MIDDGFIPITRRYIRSALIGLGLWPILLNWFRWSELQLARVGIYQPEIFRTPIRDPLTRLHHLEARAQSSMTASSLLWVLHDLVAHASLLAEPSIARMMKFRLPKDVCRHVGCLETCIAYIRSLPDLGLVLADPLTLAEFYRPEGFQLFPCAGSRKLIVVFTTIYNHFDVSNAVLYALLKRFDASILILKDPTIFTYRRGVDGLGEDLEQVGHAISELAASIGCDQLYVMGFSSGGYSSLLFSYLVKCDGYLGFSVQTRAGFHDDPLPRRQGFSPAQRYLVRKKISPRFQVNIRSIAEMRSDNCRRTLVFGTRDKVDTIHAHDVAHCSGFKLLGLDQCDHQTVFAAIERGVMDDLITELLDT